MIAQRGERKCPAIRPFCIAVAGTHSTGKTTFIEELKRRLAEAGLKVGTVGDLAREARQLGFGILREHSYESTLWIMTRGISEELAAALSADVVLVDRPAPDALGYLRAALEFREESLDQEKWGNLCHVARMHVRHYDRLYKTVLDEEIAIDTTKERDQIPAYRSKVDRCIEDVFDELEIEALKLPRDQRQAALKDSLSGVSKHFGEL